MSSAFERRFDATPDAPANARAFLRSAISPTDGERADVAALLLSELVTNVVCYVHSSCRVELSRSGALLHVEVSDDEPDLPHLRTPRGTEGGYGLRLVDALSNAWGVRANDHGKTVWFDVGLP